MNRFRGLCFAALVLALATVAHAQLGDTLAEATRHYGAATERTATLPATLSRSFTTGDITIEADFINNTVHRLSYRRPRVFSEEEIRQLLAENAGSYSWLAQSNRLNPVRDAIGQRVWLRSDRGSASLTRHTDGDKISESLVLTDAAWLMANLKLITAPKPATPATSATLPGNAPAMAETSEHSLTWTDYDGVNNPTAAHLMLDGQELGSGDAGLVALKHHLAALPAKSQVKIIPYYGDPGAAALKHPPFNLAELRTYCEAHDLRLLVPQSQ